MMTAKVYKTGRKSWKNWHESVRQKIRDLYDIHNPEGTGTSASLRQTTAIIQDVLGQAMAQDVRVRGLGAAGRFRAQPRRTVWCSTPNP